MGLGRPSSPRAGGRPWAGRGGAAGTATHSRLQSIPTPNPTLALPVCPVSRAVRRRRQVRRRSGLSPALRCRRSFAGQPARSKRPKKPPCGLSRSSHYSPAAQGDGALAQS